MTPEQLRAYRAERRAACMAVRTLEELLALPDSAAVQPLEAAMVLRISVESLINNRMRKLPPIGFKVGNGLRFTMGEIRDVMNGGSRQVA